MARILPIATAEVVALLFRHAAFVLTIGSATTAAVAQTPAQGDFVVRDFVFTSGERLPELKLHYRTLGTLRRDASGRATNAVLIMHGTGGTGNQFLSAAFAGQLFGSGQLLDTSRHFIILPDAIGHADRASQATGCARHSRATDTRTWLLRSTAWSPNI